MDLGLNQSQNVNLTQITKITAQALSNRIYIFFLTENPQAFLIEPNYVTKCIPQ